MTGRVVAITFCLALACGSFPAFAQIIADHSVVAEFEQIPDSALLDAAAVRLAPLHGKKVDPKRIRHLQAAASMGLGRLDIAKSETQLSEI